MAEFDFAPRPPKQTDKNTDYAPFSSAAPPTASAERTPRPVTRPSADAAQQRERSAAHRNPAETGGMLSGMMSMATTFGMAQHTTQNIPAINSPSGLLGLLRGLGGAKHEQAGDQHFDLDLSRNGSPGGGIGGMTTGLGSVGGPAQSVAKREATNSAMKALSGIARGQSGGLSAVMGLAGKNARNHMQWLDEGVKALYKIER